MKLKEVGRKAVVAWSPSTQHPDLVAMGTVAGALDASFSSSAELEIFPMNLAQKDLGLKRLGSAPSPHHFQKLSWGVRGLSYYLCSVLCFDQRPPFRRRNGRTPSWPYCGRYGERKHLHLESRRHYQWPAGSGSDHLHGSSHWHSPRPRVQPESANVLAFVAARRVVHLGHLRRR